ncbi:S66 peptidase family protein [Flindersiella endophytica]
MTISPSSDGPPELRRPQRLRAGDQVAVVCPAGPPKQEVLTAGLEILRSWGLAVRLGEHVSAKHPRLNYLAATDAQRTADLQAAWCDPDVRAVFCARGGYGSMRLLDRLDWDAIAAAGPKLLVGSSDITGLHQVLGSMVGVATVFGPMVGTKSFSEDPVAQEHLRALLFEPESEAATVLAGPAAEPMFPGEARGQLVGGNLSLVVSGRGVPDVPPPPPGAIGLLEDVNEEPYRIDHFLTHLRRAGWFDKLGGLALGSWNDCGDDPAALRAVVEDRVGDLGIPVIWELGFGHCRGQLSMPLGVEAELVSDPATGTANVTLTRPALT